MTASRIASFQSDTISVVHLRRKADFMVVNAFIESDSKAFQLRQKEVSDTLRSLAAAASCASNIEPGLLKVFETDDRELEYLRPFELDNVEWGSGYRQDTSRVSLIIRTPINAGDTDPDEVYGRIEAFIDLVKVTEVD